MTDLVWLASFVAAAVFLVTGFMKIFRYEDTRKRIQWVEEMPRGLVTFTGVVEILGALGLVLPALTGILPWLSSLAAAGLTVLMFMASSFHLARKEKDQAATTFMLLIMVGFVAYGRYISLQGA